MPEPSGGHWLSLAEAQKLTDSTNIPGVFETDIKRNNPLDRLPVAQASGTGKSIKWLLEKLLDEEAAVHEAAPGQLLSWDEDTEYDEEESEIRILYIQRKLDKFVQSIYGTYNNYRAQAVLEMEKLLKRKVGNAIVYADETYGGSPTQMEGMHAHCARNTAARFLDLNIDCGGTTTGLKLSDVRKVEDAMTAGVDEIWVPPAIYNQINAAYEEKGFAGLKYDTAGALAMITRGMSDIGKQVLFWNGIPLVRTDFLVAEAEGTGVGTNKRGKYVSGNKMYSIFFVKTGNVMARETGITLAFGATEGEGDFYKVVPFSALEGYDAEGLRMVSYCQLLRSTPIALGRIYDIADAAITA